MDKLIEMIGELNSDTLMILVFAAVLLIFLLVLIIVTIKILRSNESEEDADDDELETDTNQEEDENSSRSKMVDEIARSVEEAKAKMEAEMEAEKSAGQSTVSDEEASEEDLDKAAKESAKRRVEEIAKSVTGEEQSEESDEASDNTSEEVSEETSNNNSSDEASDDESEDSPVSQSTDKLETVRIEEELRKVRSESLDSIDEYNLEAKRKAESPDYNASFDSAFVETPGFDSEAYEQNVDAPIAETKTDDQTHNVAGPVQLQKGVADSTQSYDKITVNPVNEVHINTVNSVEEVNTTNPKAGINDMKDMKEFMEENPKPKEKKRKVKKKDKAFEEKFGTHGDEIKTAKHFWYNTQDIEGLARKEDMYFKCHYFDNADDAILDLVTEMYDCAYVRTEQLQRIAYGITFQSIGMKDILRSEENLGFDKEKAVKQPSQADKEEIYKKWCEYVDNFMKIIEINAPDSVKNYIVEQMYAYGHKDVEELMYSPY